MRAFQISIRFTLAGLFVLLAVVEVAWTQATSPAAASENGAGSGLFALVFVIGLLAITGIAGPEGGTPEKPVGMVCIAWAGREMTPRVVHTVFQGDRLQIRQQACLLALQGLLDLLEAYSQGK